MKLTRRESTLLKVLGIILLAAGAFYFLLQPLQSKLAQKKALHETLELQKVQMEVLLASADMENAHTQQKAKAQENYDSFYSTLNSYTIDSILNGLMDEHAIQVLRMDITPYEQTVWDAQAQQPIQDDAQAAARDAQENILLKSTVYLEAAGTYVGTLQFLNAMNEKSFCLRVRAMDLELATENNLLETETAFSCTIDIYGIESTAPQTANLT